MVRWCRAAARGPAAARHAAATGTRHPDSIPVNFVYRGERDRPPPLEAPPPVTATLGHTQCRLHVRPLPTPSLWSRGRRDNPAPPRSRRRALTRGVRPPPTPSRHEASRAVLSPPRQDCLSAARAAPATASRRHVLASARLALMPQVGGGGGTGEFAGSRRRLPLLRWPPHRESLNGGWSSRPTPPPAAARPRTQLERPCAHAGGVPSPPPPITTPAPYLFSPTTPLSTPASPSPTPPPPSHPRPSAASRAAPRTVPHAPCRAAARSRAVRPSAHQLPRTRGGSVSSAPRIRAPPASRAAPHTADSPRAAGARREPGRFFPCAGGCPPAPLPIVSPPLLPRASPAHGRCPATGDHHARRPRSDACSAHLQYTLLSPIPSSYPLFCLSPPHHLASLTTFLFLPSPLALLLSLAPHFSLRSMHADPLTLSARRRPPVPRGPPSSPPPKRPCRDGPDHPPSTAALAAATAVAAVAAARPRRSRRRTPSEEAYATPADVDDNDYGRETTGRGGRGADADSDK